MEVKEDHVVQQKYNSGFKPKKKMWPYSACLVLLLYCDIYATKDILFVPKNQVAKTGQLKVRKNNFIGETIII